ncbi:ATP-binding protein [Tropicimonas sp. S265A]|uniref:ATP-binding protein n=1 Tax=Tropicimonas sp. S265A TaxID=3415134 RepID=UPI003C7EC641
MTPSGNAQDLRRKFEARSSPRGRFASYVRGRLTHFWMRQTVLFAGAAFVGWLSTPLLGLWIALIGTLGEVLDCAVLRRLLPTHADFDRLLRLSTYSAAMHATLVSGCVALAWHAGDGDDSRFFAIACMAGAVINAGLVYPFHPSATRARISVYLLSLGGLFAIDGLVGARPVVPLKYDAVGVLILAFSIYAFIAYLHRLRAQRWESERALIVQQAEVDAVNQQLLIREREARRMALVAENANDSVLVTDCEGRIEYVNKSFERITGYSFEDAKGQLPADLLNSPNTDPAAIRKILVARQNHVPVRVELLNRTKDGRDIWIETVITPMLTPSGTLIGEVAVERDISRQKDREHELACAKVAAEEGARTKERFLAMVSHEMRTPLNGIIGLTENLLDGDLSCDQRRTAQTVLSSGESLLTIINDILDLSKLEAGRMEVTTEPVIVPEVATQIAALLAPLASEKGLSLVIETGSAPETAVQSDQGRLRQILLNLVGNAIKFTHQGEVRLAIQPSVVADMPGLVFHVSDTGVGIPKDRIDHIFDAFAQADASIAREFGGTGLGLAISKKLARQMGGDISVTSAIGSGTCFSLTLPAPPVQTDAPSSAVSVASPPVNSSVMATLRVLVAEDNKTNRLLMQKLLAPLCMELSFAHDGEEAAEKAGLMRPDLILMDMQMPRCDGLESARRIRAEEVRAGRGRAPIVALTANGYAGDRDACLASGMDGFLTKPVRRQDLFVLVAELIPATLSQAPEAETWAAMN